MSKSDNILKLSRSITLPDWADRVPKTGSKIDVAARLIRDTISIDEAAIGAIDLAGADPDLSDSGKGKARGAAGEIQIGLLGNIEAETHAVISKAVAEARANAKKGQSAAALDKANRRAGEIRHWLYEAIGDDGLKLEIFIREAIDRNDTETLDAILEAPFVWPLAQSFDRSPVAATRSEMVDASLGEEIVELVRAEKDVLDRLQLAKENISKHAGLNANDDGIEAVAHADIA